MEKNLNAPSFTSLSLPASSVILNNEKVTVNIYTHISKRVIKKLTFSHYKAPPGLEGRFIWVHLIIHRLWGVLWGLFSISTHQTAHGIHYVSNLSLPLRAFVNPETRLSNVTATDHDSTIAANNTETDNLRHSLTLQRSYYRGERWLGRVLWTPTRS